MTDRHGLWQDLRANPAALAAVLVALACAGAALLAPWIAPHDPHDLAAIDLADAGLPPAWQEGGSAAFPLGTDDQGRDLLSAILHGTRISLAVGLLSVLLSALAGVTIGLVAGYRGGWLDAALMRLCDVALSFPPILVALLVSGVGRAVFPQAQLSLAFGVVVAAIALTGWVPYARTVRATTRVERGREYVLAARVMGVAPGRILRRHVLPNVLGPVLVLATVQVATAILTEATLSFLGVGVPPTSPSLGTLIRLGQDHLFSGAWWLVACPGAMLVLVSLSVNLFGDWLRDALNPRLR